jgi:hypothetical protein
MFKGKGVILKSSIQIRHGRVSRITGICEKGKVSKLEIIYHSDPMSQMGRGLSLFNKNMGKKKGKNDHVYRNIPEEDV